jgi:mRNA interferase YafQ
MYHKIYTKQFKRSIRKIEHSGLVGRKEIESFIDALARGGKLTEKHKDHILAGGYIGYRECHIRPDLLLIYKIEEKILILILANIGSHSELF